MKHPVCEVQGPLLRRCGIDALEMAAVVGAESGVPEADLGR